MNIFANLRLLAYVRRAVRALESLAESQHTLATITAEDHAHAHRRSARTQLSFEPFDQTEANRRWKTQREEAMVEN